MLRPDTFETRRAEWHGSGAGLVLAAVLDSVDCGVLLFGTEGDLRLANDTFAKLFGTERSSLRDVANFDALLARLAPGLAKPDGPAVRWRQCFERGETSWDEIEVMRPERRVLERFARPVMDEEGRRLAWIEIYRDVTPRRLIEAKLFQTERVAALGQLVSGVAHELNNPLTSIVGYAQMLARRRGADFEGDAQRILQEAERARRIAKNLLRFARETKSEREPVDLNEILDRTLDLRRYQLHLESIVVEVLLGPSLPPVLADAGQLQQVLLNLILNAEQAIHQGGGPGHIWVRTYRAAADFVAFDVADDGPGVASEVLPRIFDPFFTTKPAGVGTGLGLSIVFGIVQEHGGKVLVRRRPGGGALFTVELPALMQPSAAGPAKPVAPFARVEEEKNVASTPAIWHRERILVVEDEPTVAQLIADVLGEEGHPVDAVLDSREALARIARISYDLVICDLRMPHLDGRGLYRELVRQGSPLRRRFVFVTGDTLAPHTLEFLETSGVPYVAKPFLVEELKQAVEKALAAAKEQQADVLANDPERNVWPIRSANGQR